MYSRDIYHILAAYRAHLWADIIYSSGIIPALQSPNSLPTLKFHNDQRQTVDTIADVNFEDCGVM